MNSPKSKTQKRSRDEPMTPETPTSRFRALHGQDMTPTKKQFYTSPIKRTPSKDAYLSESSSETDDESEEETHEKSIFYLSFLILINCNYFLEPKIKIVWAIYKSAIYEVFESYINSREKQPFPGNFSVKIEHISFY